MSVQDVPYDCDGALEADVGGGKRAAERQGGHEVRAAHATVGVGQEFETEGVGEGQLLHQAVPAQDVTKIQQGTKSVTKIQRGKKSVTKIQRGKRAAYASSSTALTGARSLASCACATRLDKLTTQQMTFCSSMSVCSRTCWW
jgi:hypothetical protein